MASLEKADAWQKLIPADRDRISAEKGLHSVPQPAMGTPDELLAALDLASLEAWRQRFYALPSRFAEALAEASRIHEPKAVRVALTPATLKTEAELDAWLADTRQKIAGRLKDGPVLV